MRSAALLAAVLVVAAVVPASAQATLPRTGPSWTFPNGFGQRWITPAPGRRFSTAPGFPSGRFLHGSPSPFFRNRYGFGGPYAPIRRYPASPGGHIYFYYGPGLAYQYPTDPRFFPRARVYRHNPSPTACWF